MSNQDRGAYTPPTDAPLSFDARQPVRGSRPVPVTLLISAVVLVLLVIAIAVFYRSGVQQAGQAPQAVGTPVGEIKAPAPVEAQPEDPAAGLQIYQSESGQAPPAQPNFTPPPEAPAARPAPANAAPVTILPPAPKPAPVTAPVAAQPAAPKAAAAVVTPAPAAAGGPAAVQIGAFSSQALADKGWNDAAAIAPGLAAGKGKRVEQVAKDGGTLYRTTVTGFANRVAATAFCDALKAAGKSCFVK